MYGNAQTAVYLAFKINGCACVRPGTRKAWRNCAGLRASQCIAIAGSEHHRPSDLP